jgi:hypothetical protein
MMEPIRGTMSLHKMKFKREELYNAVWEKPLCKLASELGVGVHNIVTACRDLNIPRPSSGHWQVIARGWMVERKQLPPEGQTTPALTDLDATTSKAKSNLSRLVKVEKIPVVDDVRQLHPRIFALYTEMKDAPVIDHGPVKLKKEGNFDLWVSKKQMRRALFILDAIVKGLESRGATFESTSNFNKFLVARLNGGKVEFRLFEKMKAGSVVVRREPIGSGFINDFEWRYTPLGKLSFSITDYWPTETRKNWNDGVHQRLENKVSEIIEQIFLNPEIAKQQCEARENAHKERQRIWHEDHMRRTASERLAKMTNDLKTKIEDQGRQWEKARSARHFLAACEQTMRAANEEPLQDWQKKWLAWGKEWVNNIDPLANGFLGQLKSNFEELKELEAFVGKLRIESPALFEKKDEMTGRVIN